MPAPMRTTSVPGVYARGSRWVVVDREDGRQRKESVATFAAARELKVRRRAEAAARHRGPTVHTYAWSGSITTPAAAVTTSSTIAPGANTVAC